MISWVLLTAEYFEHETERTKRSMVMLSVVSDGDFLGLFSWMEPHKFYLGGSSTFSAFVKDFLTCHSLIRSGGKPSTSYLLPYILACLACTDSVNAGNLRVTKQLPTACSLGSTSLTLLTPPEHEHYV